MSPGLAQGLHGSSRLWSRWRCIPWQGSGTREAADAA